jgi:multiple sugar transport system ATP-binding protein
MTFVTLNNIGKRIGKTTVLQDVSFEIAQGEMVVIAGPSGSGKTTLLRLLCGLDKVSTGELHMEGVLVNQIPPVGRGVSMVFQNYALYPHMDVRRNIVFGLQAGDADAQEMAQRVDEAAKALNIEHLLQHLPHMLSGTQQHRVAMARAYVRKPRLLLVDEQLSHMDATVRAKSRIELARLHRNLATTMVCVAHDHVEAMALGNKIVLLRAGRVQQVGSPHALYTQPVNRFVAHYIGAPSINLMPAQVIEVKPEGVLLRLRDGNTSYATVDGAGLQVGESVELGFRPEHGTVLLPGCAPKAQDTSIDAQVTDIEHQGDANFIHLKTDNGQILVLRAPSNVSTSLGQSVILQAAPQSLYLFKSDGSACARLHP